MAKNCFNCSIPAAEEEPPLPLAFAGFTGLNPVAREYFHGQLQLSRRGWSSRYKRLGRLQSNIQTWGLCTPWSSVRPKTATEFQEAYCSDPAALFPSSPKVPGPRLVDVEAEWEV